MEPRKPRTCKCGYTREHANVVEEPEYTLWGWIQISIIGITPRPDHIVYRCQMCRQSLGVTRDPELLARRSQPKPPTPPKPEEEPKEEKP